MRLKKGSNWNDEISRQSTRIRFILFKENGLISKRSIL